MKQGVLETIGSPLVQLEGPTGATVAAKLESANPGGSAKDRPARAMIRAAEEAGEIEPGDRLVEPTSGNTGIGLSLACAARGYDLTIVMPASKSEERRRLMRAYGAEIDLVEGSIEDARERARELADEGATLLEQFENAANPGAHYRTTGPEILEQVGDREVDAFVAGVGTGGTISGTGRRLREAFPDVRIVAVEPERNAVLSTGEAGEDDYQGMGPGFVSPNLDRDLLDDAIAVPLEDAEAECRRLAREEGILVGQSSGAASLAAKQVARELADPDSDCPPAGEPLTDGGDGADATEVDAGETGADASGTGVTGADASDAEANGADRSEDAGERDSYDDCPLVVTVFPDSGERYLSTGLF